jgi:RNA-directed DNA polymerase
VRLMERVVASDNVVKALKRVEQNKGSPGTDGMTTQELRAHLREAWPQLREQLLAGSYQPTAVREQEIPKSGGGVRKLGIPTVLDRFIQQAILQVLQPIFDPTFSEGSYGFRPGRSAHDAVRAAHRLIQSGKTWVVDVDLEKFFDRVNHDVLMGRLASRISDTRLLRLIRRYLNAGVMANGVVMERQEGTPQGGPLSPLLANVLLDDVDKELEKRGLAFARYADDCNVYVSSRRAADDAMAMLRRAFAGLRLRINEAKSAVDRPWNRKFLGFSFWHAGHAVKLRVAPKALETMKERVRQITSRAGGRSIQQVADELRSYLVGWKNYFRLADTQGVYRRHDEWIRHRLRALQLKHWKRGTTAYRELRRLGASEEIARRVAGNLRRWWRNAAMHLHFVMPIAHFDRLGVPRLAR